MRSGRLVRYALGRRVVQLRRVASTEAGAGATTTRVDPKLRQELAELTAELQHPRKSNKLVTGLGFAAALLLAGAFIDEAMNVAFGLHSSTWEAVEGEVVSEPVVSYAGAMLMRREVGVRYKYFVQPGEDDEAKDEPGAGEHEEDSLYATPRKGLLTGLVDFVVEPDPQGEFGRQLAELYPVGSKVKVYYNSESPSRACLVPGLPVPNGPFRLPFYLAGVPFLMALARSSMPIPIRFAYFAIATMLWTELDEESERIFHLPMLEKYIAKPILSHPPLLTEQKN